MAKPGAKAVGFEESSDLLHSVVGWTRYGVLCRLLHGAARDLRQEIIEHFIDYCIRQLPMGFM